METETPNRSEYARAWDRLTRYLALRDHSEAELKAKLSRHHAPEIIAQILEHARTEGVVASDETIAARKRAGFERRLKSRRYIEGQLRQKGLPVPAPSSEDDAGEVAKARELVERKFGDPVQLSFEERGRAFRYLKYRGYEDRHIKRVFINEEQ